MKEFIQIYVCILVVETINYLIEEKVIKLIKDCEGENSWLKLIRVIGVIFNNVDLLIMSFRRNDYNISDYGNVVIEEKGDERVSVIRFDVSFCDKEVRYFLDLEVVRRIFKVLMKISGLFY